MKYKRLILLCLLACFLIALNANTDKAIKNNIENKALTPVSIASETPSSKPSPTIDPEPTPETTPVVTPLVFNEDPIKDEFISILKLGDAKALYDYITELGSDDMLRWRTEDKNYYAPFITNSVLDFGTSFSELYIEPIEEDISRDITDYIFHSNLSDTIYYFNIYEDKIDFTYLRYSTAAAYLAEDYLTLIKQNDVAKLARFLIEDDLLYGEDKAKVLLENYRSYFDFNNDIKVEYARANYNNEYNFNFIDESGKTHQFIIGIGDGIPYIRDTMGPSIYE